MMRIQPVTMDKLASRDADIVDDFNTDTTISGGFLSKLKANEKNLDKTGLLIFNSNNK